VRRAKDNRQVPTRYYRPTRTRCPRCGQVLKRAYPWWRKYVVFLRGRELVSSIGYRCPNPACLDAQRGRMHTSPAAERLTLRGSSFALEVIVQIGYWRFWNRWTVAQIHAVLTGERHLSISEREVLYLIGVFLVLLRCTYPLRVAEHATSFRRHGVFLSIDALKPEKGNHALYVVRELKFGLVLQVASVLSATHTTLETRVLRPAKVLGYRVRGVVSDDEPALCRAVAQMWPGVAHQTCQWHCLRDAAAPLVAADQALKKALKRAIREPLYAVCRTLDRVAPEDPCSLVLATYADLIRATLTEGSKPPFALGGLRVFEDLARLDGSLQRSRQKGAIRCWTNCWPWCSGACPSPPPIGNSNASAGGWWSWSGSLIHQWSMDSHDQVAIKCSNRSRRFWRSCGNTPSIIRKRQRWSPISARPLPNAGPASSLVMPGRSGIAPTMSWKLSLVGYVPVSVKPTGIRPPTTLSSATESGRSSLTRRSLLSKCCGVSNSSSRKSLITSTLDSRKRNNGFKCCIVFAISLAVVSQHWSKNGLKPYVANLVNPRGVNFAAAVLLDAKTQPEEDWRGRLHPELGESGFRDQERLNRRGEPSL
jgi:hypothetical protein